jgi:hypothetical protein
MVRNALHGDERAISSGDDPAARRHRLDVALLVRIDLVGPEIFRRNKI